MHVLWNEKIVNREEVTIDIEDRGYQYGDGLYEVVRIYAGKMYMIEEHLERLWTGAQKIKLTLPFTREKLVRLLNELIEAESVKEGKLYFQVTRGIDSPRNHRLPNPKEVKAVLTGNVIPYEKQTQKMEQGITASVVEDTRWLHCDIKSLSLMGNILSLEEARSKGFDDAVLVRDGKVTEASAANFWMVKGNTIYTHPANNLILSGITRKKMIELAKANGLTVIEEAFDEKELYLADECFITGTLIELIPVVKIDNHLVGKGTRGAVAKRLQEAYAEAVKKEFYSEK